MVSTRPLNGLLIGSASAATQIEGGDRNNQWWEWAPDAGQRGRRLQP